MAGGFCNLALNALFPRFCLSCKCEGTLFCGSCENAWVARPMLAACPFCAVIGSNATCESCKSKTYLDGVIAYLPYGNAVVRGAISFWKFDGDKSIEPILKKWLLQSANRMRPPFDSFVVTHIPIHKTRKRLRGFDQAERLSHWVAEMYAMPQSTLIERTRKTASQAKMDHAERYLGQLDEAFAVRRDVIDHLPEAVLLCDDVFTSGATMDAAAKCLKESGVKIVWGFVIGKG